MRREDIFPNRWADRDFIEKDGNILLPDGGTIWLHGIATTSAELHAHLRPAYRHFFVYRSADMKAFLPNFAEFPHTRAVYVPSVRQKGMPTARGLLANVDDFMHWYWHEILEVPQSILNHFNTLNRYDAGQYAERTAWAAVCAAYDKSFRSACREENLKYGIDGYTDGVTTQIKADTPNTPNIFVQTHTNNNGWWNQKLASNDA